jgi:hypothetical protein
MPPAKKRSTSLCFENEFSGAGGTIQAEALYPHFFLYGEEGEVLTASAI